MIPTRQAEAAAATKLQAAWRGKMGRNAVAFKKRMRAAASRTSAIEGMDDLLAGLLEEEGEVDEEVEEGQEGAEEEEAEEDVPLDDLQALAQDLLQPEDADATEERATDGPESGVVKESKAAVGDIATGAEPEADEPRQEDKPKRRKKKKKTDAEAAEEEGAEEGEELAPAKDVEKGAEEAEHKSAKTKKTGSRSSAQHSTKEATEEHEHAGEEDAEEAEHKPAKTKKTGSRSSAQHGTKEATEEHAGEEEAEEAEHKPAKTKKTGSRLSAQHSTKEATEEHAGEEEAEEAEHKPAKTKKTGSRLSAPHSTKEATEEHEHAGEEDAEEAEHKPAKTKKTGSRSSAQHGTKEATEEHAGEEEAEEAEHKPAKTKKTGSRLSAQHSTKEATEEHAGEEDAEEAEHNPAKTKKTGSRSSAQHSTPQDGAEVEDADYKPAIVKKSGSNSSAQRGAQEASAQDEAELDADKPKRTKKKLDDDQGTQKVEEVRRSQNASKPRAEKSPRGSHVSGGQVDSQPTAAEAEEQESARSPGGPETTENEEGDEELEEEAEIFDCEAGEDVKELGLMPTAFAPDPVEIASVTDGLWAANMGVQPGDMLIKINGTPVEAMDKKEMKRAMRERPLSLTISRFATEEESMDDVETFECTAPEGIQDLGLYPSAFPPEAMMIATVTPGSWAAQQGIEVGDELVEIGQRQVQEMVAKETKRAMRDRPLRLVFQRVLEATPTPSSPAASAPASAPTSSPPAKQRKSQKPPPDILTQATNQARKSLAAILPEGLNPLAQEANLSCKGLRPAYGYLNDNVLWSELHRYLRSKKIQQDCLLNLPCKQAYIPVCLFDLI